MASSLRCSYLLAVVVAAVLFGVCSAQSQQYHPQPNVLTGLNHQAVGATSSSSFLTPILYIYIYLLLLHHLIFRLLRNQFSNALSARFIFIFRFFDV
jgi:preprotein translocase subunit SecG